MLSNKVSVEHTHSVGLSLSATLVGSLTGSTKWDAGAGIYYADFI